MYEQHFGLTYRPFPPSAAASCYVPVGTIEAAREAAARCVQRASGPAVVIGGAGTGKTMLCEVLAQQFSEQFRVAHLNNGRLPTPRALLQVILFEFGRPYRDLDENELRLSLADYVASDEHCPHGLLLIIDEAHALPVRVLEEIRLLTNNATQGQSRVRLVLAGAASLEEKLNNPKLESFQQRIAARAYLESLSREETQTFIREQLASVGGSSEAIFPLAALNAVYDATDGIPRLVNQLCDHALIVAAVNELQCVAPQTVQEAWADLQQLPSPWIEPLQRPGKAATAEIIEFASLADDDEQSPAPIPFPQRKAAGAEDVELLETASYRGFVSDDQLDEVERTAAKAQSISASVAADERPAAAEHPFGDAFDEEQVLVDDCATIEENYLAAAKRVTSDEGREIGKLLAGKAIADPAATARQTTPPAPAAETLGRREQQALTEAVAALLANSAVARCEQQPADASPAASEPHPDGDDRYLIVVQDEIEEMPSDRPPAKVKRQKYRQLFAKLRQA